MLLGGFIYSAVWLLALKDTGELDLPRLVALAPFLAMAAIFALPILARCASKDKSKDKPTRVRPISLEKSKSTLAWGNSQENGGPTLARGNTQENGGPTFARVDSEKSKLTVARSSSVSSEEKAKAKSHRWRMDPSDMFYLQVFVAFASSSVLWALQEDNDLNTFPPVLVSPWLLLELHWLQNLCWSWILQEVTLSIMLEGIFGCFCRIWSTLYLVGWPKTFGPWTVLFCPALLIALVDFLMLLHMCMVKSVGTPLQFAIEVSLSAELRRRHSIWKHMKAD